METTITYTAYILTKDCPEALGGPRILVWAHGVVVGGTSVEPCTTKMDEIPLPEGFQTWDTAKVLGERGWPTLKGEYLIKVADGCFHLTIGPRRP